MDYEENTQVILEYYKIEFIKFESNINSMIQYADYEVQCFYGQYYICIVKAKYMIPITNQKEALSIMAQTQQETKNTLKEIAQISKQLVHKIAEHSLLSSYLLDAIEQNRNQPNNQPPQTMYQDHMEDLRELSADIKSLLKQKAAISESLYINNANRFEFYESLIQEDDKYLSSKEAKTLFKEYLSSEEIVNIIHDYQAIEVASMCICNGVEKSDDMIKCDNSKCKARWFHLKCVGIQPFSIPQGSWQCRKCSE